MARCLDRIADERRPHDHPHRLARFQLRPLLCGWLDELAGSRLKP
jgi:hypothetical protein